MTKAFSAASIGKAYLRAMGIPPILERQADFPKKYLGYAQSAFFGGRTGVLIRKFRMPVVYVDFLSMYPTVNSLMGLWAFVTAQQVSVVEHCRAEVQAFLSQLTPDDLFRPETWPKLRGFVKIVPDGDILPSRGQYSTASNDWQVGVNHVYADPQAEKPQELWFALPDIVASVILTGRVPQILDAIRIESRGKLAGLKPTLLNGVVSIDPAKQDFFKVVIEERKRIQARKDWPEDERNRHANALKLCANSSSYGIYAEMNRQEDNGKKKATCYGIDAQPYECRVKHPEAPGPYCFPPMASLITAGARLMLALLEHSVASMGGTRVMEDTDSMAIVATRTGGLIQCPGGPLRLPDGREAVRALSWDQVRLISQRFAALNPYDRGAVPESILEIEKENFDPKTGEQRVIYCYAISAKRYAMFLSNEKDMPIILRQRTNNKTDRYSEHGLGHLRNPTDPEGEDRNWIGHVWESIVRESMGLPWRRLPFEELPAVGRVTVSSTAVLKPLAKLNEGRPYEEQIKPSNFLHSSQVIPFGHPSGADPNQFHLIAPYEADPGRWLKLTWIDQYTGRQYRITTDGAHGGKGIARVKTYRDVLAEYRHHPEAKCADASGAECGKQTIGLMWRRHVLISEFRFIGKESNFLEDVEEGLIQSADDVYTEYPDSRRDEWQTKIVPALKRIPLPELIKESGMSRRALMDLRAGRRRPHPKNQVVLEAISRKELEN